MFVPRGVPLQAKLYATRGGEKRMQIPVAFEIPPALARFDGDFTVAATGDPAPLRFAAPSDLAQQLEAK
jgi:hypothetical protein